ncbi:MAG: hypothetical protein SFU99_20765 [Saprospiraceae bacterium]|nr:hypothetical protein [Saprospiraceae bacterium]
MKSVFAILLTTLLFSFEPSVQIDEVKHLNGLYTGTLTYLDYTSNERVEIPLIANCYIEKNKLIQEFTINEWGRVVRQKESYEFKNGTIYADGALKLEEKEYNAATKEFRLVLTERGKDGNQQKPCIFRYTASYANDVFTMTKDVKFDGENEFFNRNEYKISRLK